MPPLFWILYRTILAGLFGLLTGSFLNVCIYRLPRRETIVHGHSYCPHCHHTLAGADLVPILSYLFLRGRCRYCRQPIAPRYARIESVTGLYFALTAWLWGDGPFSPVQGGRPAFLDRWPDPVYNAAVIACVLAAFCSLLVWAMILHDRQAPPRTLYWFIAVPAVARLVLQPDRLVLHLAAAFFAGAFWLLLQSLRLLPEPADPWRHHPVAGLVLLGLLTGLSAIQPALAVCLVFVLLRTLWSDPKRSHPERTEQLLNSCPPALVLVGFFALLIL